MVPNKKINTLILITFISLIIALSIKSYYFYKDMKEEVVIDAKKEANLLKDYMMSMRLVYHEQFLKSKLDINYTTIGFLPAHASSLISDKFQAINNYGFYIKNVSDNPRNPKNMADNSELQAINFFKNTKKDEYYTEITDKKYGNYFQFAYPIYTKQYCLSCHGKKEDTLGSIQNMYQNAYDYKVGDLRGIVSIKIPHKNIDEMLYNFLKKEIISSLIVFILIITSAFFLFTKVSKHINTIHNDAVDLASKDQLSGLNNRHYLKSFNKNILKNETCIGFIDIDYFKNINDTYGHDAGDEVIKQFANILNSDKNDSDILIRYGGEEFLYILYDINKDDAIDKFIKIKDEIQNTTINYTNEQINITASIGITFSNENNTDIDELITEADKALYEAKNNGRNKIVIYQKES
jgi:diguanylate cyclase (GGDEF)-like protein